MTPSPNNRVGDFKFVVFIILSILVWNTPHFFLAIVAVWVGLVIVSSKRHVFFRSNQSENINIKNIKRDRIETAFLVVIFIFSSLGFPYFAARDYVKPTPFEPVAVEVPEHRKERLRQRRSGSAKSVSSQSPLELLEQDWVIKGKNAMKQKLRDPDSAKFRNVFFSRGPDDLPLTCGEVDAKNVYGAYTGYERFISGGRSDLTWLESEVSDFHNAWRIGCTNR